MNLEASNKWEERYRVLPIYKSRQEAYASMRSSSKAFTPMWALLEKPNIMNAILFYEDKGIRFFWTGGDKSEATDKYVNILSVHGTKKMAEAFAKSHYETPERILLGG